MRELVLRTNAVKDYAEYDAFMESFWLSISVEGEPHWHLRWIDGGVGCFHAFLDAHLVVENFMTVKGAERAYMYKTCRFRLDPDVYGSGDWYLLEE